MFIFLNLFIDNFTLGQWSVGRSSLSQSHRACCWRRASAEAYTSTGAPSCYGMLNILANSEATILGSSSR